MEMFQVNNEVSAKLVSENFLFVVNHYNFTRQLKRNVKVDHVNTEKFDKQSVSYFRPKIWNSILEEKIFFAAFKTKIKCWKLIG